jgi:mono/diheme cytochrome c family protein
MTGMRAHGLLIVTMLAGAALSGAAGCGENPIPDRPTYERDIKPLMEANCIRCHGAGGMLNADPDIMKIQNSMAPTMSDFTQLNDVNGKFGLLHYTAANPQGGVALMQAFLGMMPPPPSDRLAPWEHDLLIKWVNNPSQ